MICLLTVERPDVAEAPALVEHGRLHAVDLGMALDGVGVVEAEGVLELVVHVGDPAAVVLGIAVLGQPLDLVLELLQTWRETGEKGRRELDHGHLNNTTMLFEHQS